MMKRNKAILCALVGIGFITSAGTVKANAMTMNTTTKTTQNKLSASEVEKLLWDLPYNTININLKDQVQAIKDISHARMAYNSLSKDEQRHVDSEALDNLKYEESLLKNVVKDDIKVLTMECAMNQLKNEVGDNNITKNKIEVNKDKIKSNRNSIDKKIEYIEKTFNELDYMMRYNSDLNELMRQLSIIEFNLY